MSFFGSIRDKFLSDGMSMGGSKKSDGKYNDRYSSYDQEVDDYGDDYDYEDDIDFDEYNFSGAKKETSREPSRDTYISEDIFKKDRLSYINSEGKSSSGSSKGAAHASNTKVLNINTRVQMQVVIAYPQAVNEVARICDYIRENNTVVVNLENLDNDVCQRIVDALAGVAYALQGEIQYVSRKIFLMAPKSVGITGDLKEELRENGILSAL